MPFFCYVGVHSVFFLYRKEEDEKTLSEGIGNGVVIQARSIVYNLKVSKFATMFDRPGAEMGSIRHCRHDVLCLFIPVFWHVGPNRMHVKKHACVCIYFLGVVSCQ